MRQGNERRKRPTPRKRRLKPWDPLDLIEGLESRVLLSGVHDPALLAAIDSALTGSSGLTAFNSELNGSAGLGTNIAVVGSGMSAYDPGAALATLLSRLGSVQYQSIPALVTALQNGAGVNVLSTSNLLDNIEMNVQFTTTTNASVLLDPNYGVTLLDPKILTMPTTLTEDLSLGAYWDPSIAPSGAAVFYVNADASSIEVSSTVSSIGPVPPFAVSGASVPGQQFAVGGAAAGNYVLAITTTLQPTSVVLDGAAIKVTGVVGTGTYQSGPLTLTAGTHTLDVTPATNSTIAAAAFVPQSGAELGFLQTSGGVTSVSFSPTFNMVLNDQPPVDSTESAGRLTLAQLTGTPLATLVSTQVTQPAPATVTASLATTVAPGANPIVFTWSNVLVPSSVTSTLTTDPTLTELNQLQAVNPTSLALGLDEVTADLAAAATTTTFTPSNPFSTPLPMLGKSLNDLIDFTETGGTGGTGSIFQTALTDYTDPVLVGTGNAIDPFSSDQQLIYLIAGAGAHNTITESASGSQLLFNLNMSIGFTSPPTPFAGMDTTSPQLNLSIPSQVVPQFTTTGTLNLSFTFGEDTSTGNFFVKTSSTPAVSVSLLASAPMNTYDTNVSPATVFPIDLGGLAIDVTGGNLQVLPQATITLTDPQTDNPPTPGMITANELISGTQPGGTSIPVPATVAMNGTASASLPISVDGGNNLGISPATINISWPNVANPATNTLNTASLSSYLAWNNVTPTNLSNGLSEFKSVLSDAPTSTALGQVVGLFDSSLGGAANLVADLEPTPSLPNFQTPAVASGTYLANPTGASWGFYNGVAGISASNSSLTQGTSNAPAGQVGFIQGGAQITRIVSNWDAGTYTLNVQAAQSVGNSSPEDFQVLINNTVVGTISPTNSTYANYSLTFAVPTGGNNSLTFQGTGTGANTVLLGDPSVITVSSQPAFTDIQSMYAFLVRTLGYSNVTLTGSSSGAVFALAVRQSYSGNLTWSAEHPVESEADFAAYGSVPVTATYAATIPLGITISSTPSTVDPFYVGGGTDFGGTINVNPSSLSGAATLGNLNLTYASGSMTANDSFSLPLGTAGQQISMGTLLSHPQSYFGKMAFTGGAALSFPITSGLPSPGSSPRVNFNWTNLGQLSSISETDSNLGNISSATTYNDQAFLNGVTSLNTEIGTWQSLPQMGATLPWIDQTFEGVIPYIGDFQSVFTQIQKLNPSSASALDNDIRNTLSLASGESIAATGADSPGSNAFEYTLSLNISNEVVNFPFAAGAGFDSLFSINAQVHVTASFSGSLTFGFNPANGFYVDGYSGSGSPQMSMTLNVGGTNGQSITPQSAGKFGNLPVGVGSSTNPAVISLNASSSVNLVATGDNGLMISTTDLAQDGPALIQPAVSGSGSMTLPFGMQLGATSSVYAANAGPGIISIFYANWNPSWAQPMQFYNPATGSDDPTTVRSQDPTNPTNATAGFGNIYFDTGEFLTDMIGPYLKDIEQYNPVPPQLLSALAYNIPVINMTPLELLANYLGGSDSGGGNDLNPGDGIETLLQIVTVISDLPTNTLQLDLSAYLPGAPATGDVGMIDGGLDNATSGFQSTLTTLGTYGITLPVFSNPHSAIAQTLLDQPTTLIEFKPGNNGYISYTASYNTDPITFPVFDLGILSANATFSAGISATLFANIDIGLTTRGLLGQGIGSGGTQTGTPNLLDGFFIGDSTFGGDGTPYQVGLKFEGHVSIGGELALGGVISIASITGSLGPEGTLGVIVNDLAYTQTPNGPIPIGIANYNGDPAGDGKAYLDELSYIASNYGPLCAVMPVASLGLNLSISATVGDPPLGFSFTVYSHDFVIANWNVPCVPVTATLASISGNTLTINPNINSELLSTSNGPNNISAGVWYNDTTGLPQGIVITESNQDQIFTQDIPFSQLTGVTTLDINGTEGDDTFNFDPNLTYPNFQSANQQTASTVQIQYLKINTLNGNDTADLSSFTTQNSNLLGLALIGGTGTDHFEGNYCPDLIELGSGKNFAYIGTGKGEVIEGAGDDAITGGNGNDTVIGGDGEASIALGDGNNIINQGTGQEQIRVGNGENLITASSTVYNSGIAANGSAPTSGNPSAPNGNQVAFIQGNSAIAQTTTGWAVGNSNQYEITISAAQRAVGNNGGEDFEVLIDDKPIGIIDPTSTTYQTYTTSTFTATSGPHLITLKGLDTAGGSNMALVDNVTLLLASAITSPTVVPPTAGGPADNSFEATVLAAGTYFGNDIVPPSNYLSGVADFSDTIATGGWTYIAGIGTDSIDVGNGQNTIYGDPGGSSIKTGVGQNIIYAGGAGTDSITGGGGNDFVSINLDNSPTLQVPAVQSTPLAPTFTVNGGSGRTLLDVQGNGQLTLNNVALIFGQTSSPTSQVQFSNIAAISLSGEGGAVSFDVSHWTGTPVQINGGGGIGTIISADDANFTLGNSSLTRSDGTSFALNGITVADLAGGASNNSFEDLGWTGSGTINGNGGNDTFVAPGLINATLTNTQFQSGGHTLGLLGIGQADLTAAAGGNANISASVFTGNVALFGQGNSNTLAGGSGSDYIVGGAGTNNTLIGNGTIDNQLVGGTGTADIIEGGAGQNVLVSSNGGGDTITTGSGGSHVYTPGNNNTIHAEGGNAIVYVSSSGDTVDTGTSTTDQILHPGQLGTVASDFVAPTTSDLWVFPANPVVPAATLPAGTATLGQWVEFGASASGGGVSSSPGTAIDPSIFATGSGAAAVQYVAWADNRDGNYQIYVASDSSSGWAQLDGSAQGGGITNSNNTSLSPSIALDSAGSPVVAWTESGDIDVAEFNPTANGGQGAWVALGSSLSTGGISNTGDASNPQIVNTASGPVVAWLDTSSGAANVFAREFNGTSWVLVGAGSASGKGVTGSSGAVAGFSLATDGNNLALSWTQNGTSAGSSIYVLENTGSAWNGLSGSSSATGISGTYAAEDPSVAFAGASLYAAWAADTDGTNNIVAAIYGASAWQPLTIQTPISAGINQVSRGAASDPVLSANGSSLDLVWIEDRLPGTPDQAVAIYANRLSGAAFVSQLPGDSSFDGILGRPTSLSSPTTLALAVDGAGHPFALWGDSSSGSSQVYMLGDTLNVAKIIYVNDATGPNDTYTTQPGKASGNTGLTPNSPLLSVSAALALATSPGDVILVDSGTYGGFTVGAANNGVVILGSPDGSSNITGAVTVNGAQNVDLQTLDFNGVLAISSSTGVELDDDASPTSAVTISGSSNVSLNNDNLFGLNFSGSASSGISLVNNDLTGTGLDINGPATGLLVNSNQISSVDIAAGSQGAIIGNNIRGGTYGGGLTIGAAFTGGINGNFIHGAVVGVTYNAAAALNGNQIFHNHTGIVVSAGSGGLGFLAGSTPNYIVDNGVGVRLLGSMQGQYVGGNDIGVTGSGVLGGNSLAAANQIESNTTGIDFTGTVQNERIDDNGTSFELQNGNIVADNLIYDNGINLETLGASNVEIVSNSFYSPSQNNIEVDGGSSDVEILNNILWTGGGYDIYVDSASRTGFFSDYNDLYTTGSGQIVYYLISFKDILDWQDDLALYDLHSIGTTVVNPAWAQPQFVNLGFGDFSVFATVAANRASSPTIGTGDPESDVALPAVQYVNQLSNPSFESGTGGWTVNPGGTTQTSNPTPFDGSSYFYSGSVAAGYAYQTVSLSSDAAAIDAGTMDVSFGGRIRSALENLPDQGQLVLTFLDGSGNAIGSPIVVSASNTTNRWELVGARVHIPAGTRSVTYRFQSTRETGGTDDSYLDAAFLYVLASNIAMDMGAEGSGDTAEENGVDEKIQLESPDLYVNWTANQSHNILWTTFGNTSGAPVRIDVYQQSGGVLNFLANITPSTADTGSYAWIPQQSGLTSGTYYNLKIEVSLVGESAIKDISTETFTVPVTGNSFYVNDGSTTGDQYSTAVGNNRNTGLLPSAPLPLITTLFRTYTLGAGNTVYVDAGTYGDFAALELSGNPAVGNGQGVNIAGPTNGHTATIDALGYTSPAVIDVNNAQYVTLSNLTLADANYGLWVRNASSNISVTSMTVTANLQGGLRIESDSSANDTLTGIVADNNTGDGVYVGGAIVSITNSTSYSNTGDGFDLTNAGAVVLTDDSAYGNKTGLYVTNSIGGTTTVIGNANLTLGLGNQFFNNSNYGIDVESGTVLVAGNTVYGQTASGDAGIEVNSGGNSITTENVVYNNYDGIRSTDNSTVTYNLAYNNPDFGFYGGIGTTFTGNVSYDNGVGIRSVIAPNAAGNIASIDNNLVYNNSVQGIWLSGGRYTTIDNNTVYQTAGDAILADVYSVAAVGIQIENNILWAQNGYDIALDHTSENGFKSDYNDLYVTANGAVGQWETVSQATLTAWQSSSGQDADSISVSPLFVSTGTDFHEQSLNSSFHGGTLAPVLNGATGLPQANPGVLTKDSSESPAIDRGDPTFTYANEPAPNGAFINLGAYGDTAQASLSPVSYVLVLQPSAGQTLIELQNVGITWRSQDTSGTVNIELLQNGTPLLAIATGVANSGSYQWTIPNSLTAEGGYTISVTRNAAPTAVGVSSPFIIQGAVTSFYVNGSSTGGIFTTAAGSDANSGLDPAHPKATIQALLAAYQLGEGDTIFVDQGTYNLSSNIVLTSANSGLTIEGVNTSTSGSGPQTILNRDNTSTISYDFDVQSAANVTIENMTIAGGYYGINAGYNNGSSTYLTVTGCTFFGEQSTGLYLANNFSTTTIQTNDLIKNNVFHASAGEPTVPSIGTLNVANQGNAQVTINGWGVGSYAMTFSAAQKATGNNGGEDFQVLVDNTLIGTIDPTSSSYQGFTTNEFTVGAGTHVIEFLGLDTAGGSNTAMIQGLQFTYLPSATYGVQSTGDQITLAGDSAYGMAYGLYVANGAGSTISGNTTYNNTTGIYAVNCVVSSNISYNNTTGIVFSGTTLSGNTTYSNTGDGINLYSGTATGNVSYGNVYGLVFSGDATASDNLFYNNTTAGISGGNGSNILGNVLYGNKLGISVVGYPSGADGGPVIENNLVYNNITGGIYLVGGDRTPILNNTIYQTAGIGLQLVSYGGGLTANAVSIRDNIIWDTAGADISVDPSVETNVTLDYNDLYFTGSGTVGIWGTTPTATLSTWQSVSEQDADSISIDPLFVNTGVDFHEQSLNGSFHGGTLAPTLNAATGLPQANPGTLTDDSNQSPAIDRGAPSDSYSNEPTPNGGYVNLGAYGNSTQASVSPAHYLFITNPAAGLTAATGQTLNVKWRDELTNTATGAGDTDTIELLTSGNGTVVLTAGAPDTGTYAWLLPNSLSSGAYQIKVIRNDGTNLSTTSGVFNIAAFNGIYYVNGASAGGVFTTAGGNDANSGLDPAHPKATIAAILSSYTLQPGNVIEVDEATYSIPTNLVLTAADSGITIEGVSGKTILNRGNLNSGAYVFDFQGATNVTLQNLSITGAYYGINASYGDSAVGLTVTGCNIYGEEQIGINLQGNNGSAIITNNTIDGMLGYNSLYGIENNYADNLTITGNTIYGGMSYGVYVSSVVYGIYTQVISSNTVYGNSTGIAAGSNGQDTFTISNNTIYDNWNVNLSISGQPITASGNTIYEDGGAGKNESSSEVGAVDAGYALFTANNVYGNDIGVELNSGEAVGNTIDHNSTVGVDSTSTTDVIQGNTIYSNGGWGISGAPATVSNNLIYGNSSGGIDLFNDYDAEILNNTIYQTTGPTFQLIGQRQNGYNPPSITLNNNIFWDTSAPDLLIDDAGSLSFTTPTSNYNDLYATGTGEIAQMAGVNFTTLASWQWELGLDTHSISVDPQFVNAANGNFHVQSTSPTIDAGNPSSEFLKELQPNGGRVNLGYDGDTAQAAPSPTATVQVLSPASSQKVQVGQPTTIQWLSSGLLSSQNITEVAVGTSTAVGEYHPVEYSAFTTSTSVNTSAINTSLVTNPAPQSVYQDWAYAAGGAGNYLLYNIPVPNGTYTIRLDWAEPYVNSVGGRTFDILLNGQTVQSAFDVYAAAGDAVSKAVARSYTVTASAGSGISLELKNDTSTPAFLNAFEIAVANAGGTTNPTANIQVSTNNGGSWTTIATSQPMDTEGRGSYVWTPTAQTSGYIALIRVVANNAAATTGNSNGPFLIASPGNAFYVSNSSTTTGNVYTVALGNNANSGTSPNQPMASIEAVLNDYQPGAGDTIYVDNGTYALFHNINIPLVDSGVTIEGPAASTGATAILNRENTTGGDYVFSFVSEGTTNVTLENLSITGAYIGINAPYTSTSGTVGVNSITIANNQIYSNSDEGILTGFNLNWTVTGNVIHNNGAYGVYLQATTSTITNNTVYNELDDGIFLSTPGTSTVTANVVSGNTVYGSGTAYSSYAGIYVDGATVSNNTVYNNGFVGIYADDYSLVTQNTVWRQTATNAVGILIDNATVTDNAVFGNYNGIMAENGAGTLYGNRIYSNTNYGLLLSNLNGSAFANGPNYVATAYSNLIYANSVGGISINGTNYDVTLRNNTVYQLIGDAVNLSGSTNASYPITIENNILWVQAGYDLDITTANQTGLISNYNLLYHTGAQAGVGKWNGTAESTLANWQSASSLDSHSSEANPLFVDSAGADAKLGYDATANNGTGYNGGGDDNFLVDAGSPAIAAGNAALEPPADLLGYPFTNPDMGAYAYRGIPADSAPATVVSATPSATQIVVVFSQPPNDIDAGAASLYTLVGAGTGGSFIASNAIVYTLTPVYQPGTNQVTLIVNGGPLPPDLYRLTIESNSSAIEPNSSASVHNLAGVALDGDGDGQPGGNYVTTFNLTAVAPTAFSNLKGATVIGYGTATTTFAGVISAGSQYPSTSETVGVTLNGVTINAPIGANGTFSATFNTAALPASATPYPVTYSYGGDANFAAASNTSTTTLTVAQATPVITWATPAGITYGTALSGSQLDATSSVPGTFAYTPAAGAVLNAGSGQILSVTFTPTDNVDYSTVSVSVTINVAKALPTISLSGTGDNPSNATQSLSFTATLSGGVPDGETVILEDASNGNKVVASGTVSNGSVAFSVPAGTLLAGTHNLIASYGGDADYGSSVSAAYAQVVQIAVMAVVVNGNNAALAGAQRSMVNSIVYNFSEAVLLGSNAFSIALNSTYASGTLATLTWTAINPNADGSSTQWVVTFSGAGVLNGSIADGVYDITLNGSAVSADANPSVAGTSRTDTFYRLFGDATGTGSVTGTDYNALLSTFNLKSTAPGYLAYFNEDGAGRIDAPDYNAFLANFGKRFKNVTSVTTI
jgi:parallel beta-helix repeat protein